MTVSAVINATATTTTPAIIPAVLSDSAHVEATHSASDAAVEKGIAIIALTCKTLCRIHMQALDAGITPRHVSH